MEALKQRVRPRHQVLILKCYPRLPKNSSAAEIKPNGSELSYLLYYASSRRSKLSKVGAFLEKKTIHDLYKLRTTSVQITLQILTAFLENPAIGGAGPQGFGLFAPYVLRILKEVLKDANEAIIVESAVPTWDSFCRHQDHITLSADAEFAALFASVVSLWADYATKEQIQSNKGTERRGKMRVGVTDNVKLRMAGLQALKSTVDSDTLGTEVGRQLNTVMPVVLQNLYDGDGDLDQIMELNNEMESQEKDKTMKSRPSMMSVRPSVMSVRDALDDSGDARAAETTVDEADRLADQEASLLALRCLKSVFVFENRAQIRTATNCVLRFIVSHRPNPIKFEKTQEDADNDDQWAIQLFKTVCTWTPVQDRFVAIFTAFEMLVTSPVDDADLFRQLLLARIISKLLASDVNLIGLSIMDVLLGLLQHILRHLRAGAGLENRNGISDVASTNDSHHSTGSPQKSANTAGPVIETETRKSPMRIRLLTHLQQCVSNLAVHVYYTDQISDMIAAIILRLRPSATNLGTSLQVPTHNPSITASSNGGDDTISPPQSDAGQNSISSPRNPSTRAIPAGFFIASAPARGTALNAISRILLCANRPSSNETSYVSTHRNPVPLQVWEGTQWLIKDPEAPVREAFVRAFKTWMTHELPKLGMEKAAEDEKRTEREMKRKSLNKDLAKRAASTASAKKAASWRMQTSVLQTIHVAVVDALQTEAQSKALTDSVPDASNTSQAGDLERAPSLPLIFSPTDSLYPPQLFSINTAKSPGPSSALASLESDLSNLSTNLNLLPLDDFRALQPPSLPAPPQQQQQQHSPKPPSSSTFSSLQHANQASNGLAPSTAASNADSDDNRSPSLAQSIGRAATLAAAQRDRESSPALSSSSAALRATTSDKSDFAPGSQTGEMPVSVAVDDLKRVLEPGSTVRASSVSSSLLGATTGGRQRSASRSKSLGNIRGANSTAAAAAVEGSPPVPATDRGSASNRHLSLSRNGSGGAAQLQVGRARTSSLKRTTSPLHTAGGEKETEWPLTNTLSQGDQAPPPPRIVGGEEGSEGDSMTEFDGRSFASASFATREPSVLNGSVVGGGRRGVSKGKGLDVVGLLERIGVGNEGEVVSQEGLGAGLGRAPA